METIHMYSKKRKLSILNNIVLGPSKKAFSEYLRWINFHFEFVLNIGSTCLFSYAI